MNHPAIGVPHDLGNLQSAANHMVKRLRTSMQRARIDKIKPEEFSKFSQPSAWKNHENSAKYRDTMGDTYDFNVGYVGFTATIFLGML